VNQRSQVIVRTQGSIKSLLREKETDKDVDPLQEQQPDRCSRQPEDDKPETEKLPDDLASRALKWGTR
jgi:hypothetical protein